jgi:hypothetical protein
MRKYYDVLVGFGGGSTPPKPYFAEYIPVKGEIKEGDTFWNPSTSEYLFASKEMLSWNYPTPNTWKKVKLFLCSRDIQVGDKVFGTILTGDNVYVSNEQQGYSLHEDIHRISLEEAEMMDAYKVIGEISSDALSFVKKGMEFDEDQLKLTVCSRGFTSPVYPVFQVKCPCCDTFK